MDDAMPVIEEAPRTKANLPAWVVLKRKAMAVRAELVLRFPAAFKGPGEPKPPLMIGVSAEIMLRCPDITKYDLGAALQDYCNGTTYLRSFFVGAQRINLDGEPVAEVTEGEITNAHTILRVKMAAQERREAKASVASAHRWNHDHKQTAAEQVVDEGTV